MISLYVESKKSWPHSKKKKCTDGLEAAGKEDMLVKEYKLSSIR